MNEALSKVKEALEAIRSRCHVVRIEQVSIYQIQHMNAVEENVNEALSALSHLEQEPAAWMWQHDETGNVGFVEAMDDENLRIWKLLNHHLRIVKPLYAHPCASGKDAERLTQHQALVLTGFTGVMCVNGFGEFHADVEKRLGRPVWTHQFPALTDEIKKAYEADFMAMLPDAALASTQGQQK